MKNQPKLFESGAKARTGEVRLSYAHLFEPHAVRDDQRPSYNAALLVPKNDKVTLDIIRQAIENAKEQGLEKKGWKKATLSHPKFHYPLRDGDAERPDDEAYEQMFFLNAKSYTNQPTLLNAKKEKITDQTEIYSGCWGHAIIQFFPFDVSGNRGIGCGINGFMKSRDDEPLAGAGNVAEDFDGEDDDDDFLG